jgi:glutamine amidotransferase
VTAIAILDYGMGNLRSVEKAVAQVGGEARITSDPAAAAESDGVILPGVGAFPKAMARVRELGHDRLVAERIGRGAPVLGICLGLQLLFDSSSEGAGAEGLGLLPGTVEPVPSNGLKVPHIGWSPVRWAHASQLTEGLGEDPAFYFVHSYTPRPEQDDDVLGTASYGEPFVCAVERPPLYGAQFHPEKSSGAGLRLLRNFVGICGG